MTERIVLGQKRPEAKKRPAMRADGEIDRLVWVRRIGGLAIGCGLAALIYKLNHAQSASAFVWLRDPYEAKVDVDTLTRLVTRYNSAFFFGALAGGALARGRIAFSLSLALLIVLLVAIPLRATEVAGGLGPAQYLDPSDKDGLALIHRASHLVQIVEMAGAFVMASLGANLGSRVSRWIIKEDEGALAV